MILFNYKKWIVAFSILLVLLFLGRYDGKNLIDLRPEVKTDSLHFAKVVRKDLIETVYGSGQLQLVAEHWLISPADAVIESIDSHPGDKVTKDSLILQLSNPKLIQQRQNAQFDLQEMQADYLDLEADQGTRVSEAEGELKMLKLDYDASYQLFKRSIVSAIEIDKQKLKLELLEQKLLQVKHSREAKLKAAKIRLQQKQDLLVSLDKKLDSLLVRAKVDGILQDFATDWHPGMTIKEGQVIARLSENDLLKVEAQVPSMASHGLATGMVVEVDSRQDVVTAKLESIDPGIEQDQAKVQISLPDHLPQSFRPKLAVSVSIQTKRLNNVLVLLKPVGVHENQTMTIYRLLADHRTIQPAKVEFGASGGHEIVVAGGLSENDWIVISDMSKYQGASSIKLSEEMLSP